MVSRELNTLQRSNPDRYPESITQLLSRSSFPIGISAVWPGVELSARCPMSSIYVSSRIFCTLGMCFKSATKYRTDLSS